jgi:hypothetical protein
MDAHLYVPNLLEGVPGRRMSRTGALEGRAATAAKPQAARSDGPLRRRPRKKATDTTT